MQRVQNASAASLMPFVEESVEPGSVVVTDNWSGYDPLKKKDYQRRIISINNRREQASQLLPRVHLAISLLKRWMLGTHQGAVSHEHLDYYLDEFVFRFNRRRSRSRGKLFYRPHLRNILNAQLRNNVKTPMSLFPRLDGKE